LSKLPLNNEVVALVTVDTLHLWHRAQILKVMVVAFSRFCLAASQAK
jgi:hypothetical protein